MADPLTLTAGAIANLAFQKFIESGAGELAKKFTTEAIAKMAPLSLALETFRPVLTRFWTVSSSRLVAFRLCSATRAPLFVLMLLAILAVLLSST